MGLIDRNHLISARRLILGVLQLKLGISLHLIGEFDRIVLPKHPRSLWLSLYIHYTQFG